MVTFDSLSRHLHYGCSSSGAWRRTNLVMMLLAFVGTALGVAWQSPTEAAEPYRSREAALLIFERGGYVVGIAEGKKRTIRDRASLPAQGLQIFEVQLRKSKVTDDDLAVIAKAVEMERLYLSDTRVSDAGVAHLVGLQDLRDLDLKSTRTTDAGVKHLVALKQLQILSLYDTPITDEALRIVAGMPTLTTLKLEKTHVTDAGMTHLTALPKLEFLALADSRITDRGVANLAKLGSLKRLLVNFCAVTDGAIPHLARMKQLTQCNLIQTYVTAEGNEALKAALPNCQIAWAANSVRKGTPMPGLAGAGKSMQAAASTTSAKPAVRTMPPAVAAPSCVSVVGARAFQPTAIEQVCRGEVPDYLRRAVIYAYPPQRKNEPELGRVSVKVAEDTPLLLAATWDEADDKSTEEWTKQRTQYYRLIREGWIFLGQIDVGEPADGKQSLFWRRMLRGEELTLHTRKTMPALVIVPAADAPPPPFADPYAALPTSDAARMTVTMWQQLLRAEKFDELEQFIAGIRRDKPRDLEGRARLSVFYEGVSPMVKTEAEWLSDLELLRRWTKAKRQSAAAHIALAVGWREFAWDARGTGYAHTVSEDGFAKYQERLEKAREFADQARKLAEKDAYLCRLEIQLAVDLGGSPDDLESILRRSLEIDPDYLATLNEAVRYFLPRWYGRPGDLEEFIDHATELTRERAGESFYALAVMESTNYHSSDIFEDFDFPWQRVKQGFADLRKRFPKSINYARMNLRFAGYHRDREEAKAAAARLTAVLPAGFKLDANTERWRRWSQDAYLQGDQTAVYDAVRYPLNRLHWTIEGKYWIAVDNESEVRVLDPINGKESAYFEATFDRTRFSALVPFSKTLVTAGWDDEVSRFNWATGEVRALGTHPKMTAAVLSTDGGEWATAGQDKIIRFWNVDVLEDEAALLTEWDMSPTTVAGIAYVPNIRTIAVGGSDNRIGFWNRDTQKKSVDLTPRKGPIRKMRISSDGTLLAVVDTRELTIWRIKEFELHATIPLPELPILDIAFSPDGRQLAAATGVKSDAERDHPVVVWSTADGSLLHTFHGHKGIVRSVCFSPDGSTLASGADDLTIRAWKTR